MKTLLITALCAIAMQIVLRGADTTNFAVGARSVTISTNGNTKFGTNPVLTVVFERGGSNMTVFETDRQIVYQPIYFANSAQNSTALGVEKVVNGSFELLSSSMPTSWYPTVNFGDFSIYPQASNGTNGLICTNNTINAVAFNLNDYILGGTNENYTYTLYAYRQGAAECWIKLDSLPSTRGMIFEKINKYDSARSISWHVIPSGKLQLRFHGGDSGWDQTVDSPFSLAVGAWAHVAVTYDLLGLNARWYINGVGTNSTIPHADGISPSDSHYVIGYSTNSNNYGLSGSLSELRIWDHIRNDSQVLTNYNRRLTGSESGLVHLWPLNEGSGVIVGDSVSSSNDGQFASSTNAPAWESISSSVYSESIIITGNTNMQLSLAYFGDGSNLGEYGVWEPVLGEWILSPRPIPNSSASWQTVSTSFTTRSGDTYAKVMIRGPAAGFTIYDQVSLKYASVSTNVWAISYFCLARMNDDLWWSGKRLLHEYYTDIALTNLMSYSGGLIDGFVSGGSATNLTSLTGATIIGNSVTASNLYGFGGSLTNMSNIQSTNITTPNLSATGGALTNISSISATNLSATTGTVVNLSSTTINSENINSTNISATNLTAQTATSTTGNFGTLNSTNLNATNFSSTAIISQTINSSNIYTTNITAGTITAGTVSGSVTGLVNSPSGTFDRLYPLLNTNAPGSGYEVWFSDLGLAVSTNRYYATPIKWENNSLFIGERAGQYTTNASNLVVGSGSMRYGTNGVNNVVVGNNSGTFLNGTNNVIIGDNSASSDVIYGINNNSETNIASTSSYQDESYSGYVNCGSFELWLQTTNSWGGDGVFNVAEIASGTTNYLGFGLGKVGGVGKMTFSAWNVNSASIVTIAATVNLPSANTWNHFLWTWERLGAQSAGSVDALQVYLVTNGVEVANSQTSGFGVRNSGATTFSMGPVVRRAAQIRIWNRPIFDTSPWSGLVPTLIKTYMDKDSVIGVTPMSDYLIHSYPIRYTNDTQIADFGYNPSVLSTTNSFARAVDLPYQIIDPSTMIYNDGNCGFIGNGAKKDAVNSLDNAWAIGKNASVTENNTLKFSGYFRPDLGYKSTDGTSGGTSNVVVWSNDGTNPVSKITLIFKNGLYSGHTTE